MEKVVLSEITEIPFVFIRGVKTFSESFEDTDIMRGEETEIMGIISEKYGKCIYIHHIFGLLYKIQQSCKKA